MKKLDLGQTITILANLGVIAGIVFLAVELQQNNALMEAAARTARAETSRVLNLTLAESSELAEIITKAQAGDDLSTAERYRLERLYNFLIAGWLAAYREYQRGLLTEDELQIPLYRNALSDHGPFPGFRDHWNSTTALIPADFRRFIEETAIGDEDE